MAFNLKSKILKIKGQMDLLAGLKENKVSVLVNLLQEQGFHIHLETDNKKEKLIRDLFSKMTMTLN